jgi:thiamine-phosphate pyrophosphorylase
MFRLPRVYPILDTESLDRRGIALAAAAAAWLEGGAGILQIRHKAHWSRELFAACQEVARLCREAGATLIINDRADFAALLNAGLHLGQDDLPPRDARKVLGSDAIVGLSSHGAAQLSAAAAEPVDYVALGPIFSTASKRRPDPMVGLDEIRRSRGLTEKPLVAIGGISLANARGRVERRRRFGRGDRGAAARHNHRARSPRTHGRVEPALARPASVRGRRHRPPHRS